MNNAYDTSRTTEETRTHRFIKLVGIASATALAFAIGPVTFASASGESASTGITADDSALAAIDTVHTAILVRESHHRTFGIKPKPMPKPMPRPMPDPIHKGDADGEVYPWVLAEPLQVDNGGLTASTQADTASAQKGNAATQQLVAVGHGQFLASDTGATQVGLTGPSQEHGIFFDDCNSNGVSDMLEVEADGEDVDENGVLDTCQIAVGDLDLDGVIGSRDLMMVLMHWQSAESIRDLNKDGVVDSADLGILLSNWSENL